TASFGVADSRNGQAPLDVIKSADEALYKAKKAGRNCIKLR
ncbi:diguanylate cyclase, partial [Vibrio parahaemolyticus]|nr:diguanylate cyclase [Vibrio parahaemolyticus]